MYVKVYIIKWALFVLLIIQDLKRNYISGLRRAEKEKTIHFFIKSNLKYKSHLEYIIPIIIPDLVQYWFYFLT